MQADNHSGSSFPGEPEFLVVGKLGKPHGVYGEILMYVYTDFPERITPGLVVYIGREFQPLQITKVRSHARGLLLYFKGYQTRDEAAELRNSLVQVRTADRPELPPGDYYHHQLLGLQVVDESDTILGRITAIIETGANDVYVVQNEAGKEVLIPAIDSVILDINLEDNQVRVHLLPGLIPGE
jgi:16S rRNA processing protein RimM